MNKAFTRNDDDAPDDGPDRDSVVDLLPEGAPNYMTPGGLERLKAELRALIDAERPTLVDELHVVTSAAVPEESRVALARRRLGALDRRIAVLQRHVDGAQVIEPKTDADDEVHFGATVKITDHSGKSRLVSIVGVDEADFARGRISWTSPLARALTGSRRGDEVLVRTPRGEEEWTIDEIRYTEIV